MRTLHFGLRVADLERSLAFYTAVGYEVVGSVPETEFGHLTMLKLPGDDFVTVELVHDPTNAAVDPGTGLSHFVIKVESLDATITELAAQGIDADAPGSPDGSDDFRTTWITDPEGNRIELVQWPAGHPRRHHRGRLAGLSQHIRSERLGDQGTIDSASRARPEARLCRGLVERPTPGGPHGHAG